MQGVYSVIRKMLSIAGLAHFRSLDCIFQVDVRVDKCMTDAAACQLGDKNVISFDSVNKSRVSQLCERDIGET